MFVNQPTKYKSIGFTTVFKNGRFFYSADHNKTFSLPVGKYIVVGNLELLGEHFYNEKIKPIEKNEPKKFNVFFGKNPHKASIFPNGDILIDNDLKNVDIITLLLLIHEVGHCYYKPNQKNTELNCDLFAVNVLKKMGYNNSQIDSAFKSITYTDRLKTLHKKLTK